MKIFRKISILLFLLFTVTGCGRQEAETENIYQIYYLNREESRISSLPYEAESLPEEQEALAEELLQQLSQPADKVGYKPVLSGVGVKKYSIHEGQITLNFDEQYRQMPSTTEVLARAAIVKTMTQIEGINYVTIQVNGENLLDSLGNTVGVMSVDNFIDNTGEDVKNYEEVQLTLYFANQTGDRLIKANRKFMYNTNISMEKLIVEQIISGPIEKNEKGEFASVYPTVNPQTKIISVTVKDMICYVNLDKTFLEQPYNVTAETTIYSLVNSLTELTGVNKVQISVDGKTDVKYRENYSFETVFERNLELLQQEKTATKAPAEKAQ